MVKKLFKHEFMALIRLMLPVEIAVLAIGIFTRFIMIFENDSIFFNVTAVSVWIVMILALFAGSLALLIFAVIRYYKNLFSAEGYLSFTLPVTPAQHIIVKAVTAVVIDIAATFIAVISFCIATSGNLLTEIVKAAAYVADKVYTALNPVHISIYIFEFIILMILGSFSNVLIYYTCITIGQTARKHRILAAVGVYFAYSGITWILSTILQIIYLIILTSSPEFFEKLGKFIVSHIYSSIHVGFALLLVWEVLISVICFVVCHTIMRKKLNLE